MYPFLFPGTPYAVSTYFLTISLGCVLGCYWFLRRADARGMTRVSAIDIALVCLVSGFIGARLLHVFWEEPAYYRENFWRVFQVWNGGFVFYGGVIGAFFGTSFFCNWRREPFWMWADMAAPPISLTYAVGRIGCFLNGCCYGRYCEVPWAVAGRHPTQLYAVGMEVLALSVVLVAEKRLKRVGQIFGTWLFLHALGRAVMEAFRADPRGDTIAGLSLGSLISLALGLFGAALAISKFDRFSK
jgi:phosphatidylglycerol:prolipoprotein diacylglycerol transferase